MRRSRRGFEHEFVAGGRRWTRTSGLLHVKHFRLSAVLGAWEAERKGLSYTMTPTRVPRRLRFARDNVERHFRTPPAVGAGWAGAQRQLPFAPDGASLTRRLTVAGLLAEFVLRIARFGPIESHSES